MHLPKRVARCVNSSDNIKNELNKIKEEIISNSVFSNEQKLKYLKVLYGTGLINASIEKDVVSIIFESGNDENIQDRIKKIKEFVGEYTPENDEYYVTDDCFEKVYEILIQQRICLEGDIVKKELMKRNINTLDKIENIETLLEGLKYSEIGNISRLQYRGNLDFELNTEYYNENGISLVRSIKKVIDETGNERFVCMPRIKKEILPLLIPKINSLPYKVDKIVEIDRKLVVVYCESIENGKKIEINQNYIINANGELIEEAETDAKDFVGKNNRHSANAILQSAVAATTLTRNGNIENQIHTIQEQTIIQEKTNEQDKSKEDNITPQR